MLVTRGTVLLRSEHGDVVSGTRWAQHPDRADDLVLRRCRGPVLDIGCGPARHVLALAGLGVPALGIDLTPGVVAWARRRGALVLQRCVFDRVPGAGRWKSALLLDGNVGIGGDPATLLRRVAELLAGDGSVLVELDARHAPAGRTTARLEVHGRPGPAFPWTSVDEDHLDGYSAAAGLVTHERWSFGARHFAELRRLPVDAPCALRR
jgi:SAM-dependent methyltransferase